MVPMSSSGSSMRAFFLLFFTLTYLSITNAAIKSFTTSSGDIFDCIAIEKQPAFEHPLLTNHVIQMKPTTIPKEIKENRESCDASSSLCSILPKSGIKCPIGTVPIKRIDQENDDLVSKQFSHYYFIKRKINSSSATSSNSTNQGIKKNNYENALPVPVGHHVVILETRMNIYGILGGINVWNPETKPDQSSSTFISAYTDKGDLVSAGWMVNPSEFGGSSRLYVEWVTGDGQGCLNVRCPGFVQISTNIPVGVVLNPVSTYDGTQIAMDVSIVMDQNKNWWFYLANYPIGYWPGELFSTLTSGADGGLWGGDIYSPPNEPTPPMGNGHLPEEGYKKACFIKQVRVVDKYSITTIPDTYDTHVYSDQNQCYHIIYYKDGGQGWDYFIYFGGPVDCVVKQ